VIVRFKAPEIKTSGFFFLLEKGYDSDKIKAWNKNHADNEINKIKQEIGPS
jgi:hypothetical protein